jgi:NAD+ kinase
MAASKKILLVAKMPMIERLDASDLKRLQANTLIDLDDIREAGSNHIRSLDQVRAVLGSHHVRERLIDDVRMDDADDVDLVITVGGDGTVFAANSLRAAKPLLTVNSDPSRSIGHFTRSTGDTFAQLFSRWLGGTTKLEAIPRLRVSIDGWKTWRCFLNDCLFTSSNPAAITRYVLQAGGKSETQMSSGVWISTAAGSTGGIRSAGMEPMPAHLPGLLFRVREPFQGKRTATILSGRQQPPVGLKLTAAMPGIDLYLDGPHLRVSPPFGGTAEFAAAPEPLHLVI